MWAALIAAGIEDAASGWSWAADMAEQERAGAEAWRQALDSRRWERRKSLSKLSEQQKDLSISQSRFRAQEEETEKQLRKMKTEAKRQAGKLESASRKERKNRLLSAPMREEQGTRSTLKKWTK